MTATLTGCVTNSSTHEKTRSTHEKVKLGDFQAEGTTVGVSFAPSRNRQGNSLVYLHMFREIDPKRFNVEILSKSGNRVHPSTFPDIVGTHDGGKHLAYYLDWYGDTAVVTIAFDGSTYSFPVRGANEAKVP